MATSLAHAGAPALFPAREVAPRPFLKWAGGKSQLLGEILARIPDCFRTYREPFVGGGAIFFGLGPRRAVLSDINDELIGAYRALRDDVHGVIGALRQHEATKEHYYAVRSQCAETLDPIEAAARMIYLNRTCFNGLYRVNRRGEFNVPFGRYANPTICNTDNLLRVSTALQGVDLRAESVFDISRRVRRGDLVYFDPPYDPTSATASFTSYTRGGFDRDAQVRLAKLFARLASRGVHVLLSNSDTQLIRSLYAGFSMERVTARRAINSRADRRGPVFELLISSGRD